MAANSTLAILPVSTTTTADQQSTPNSALRTFISSVSETVRSDLSNRRPWAELLDRATFSKPNSFSDANLRVRKNYTYFRVNYLTEITAVLAISLLTNPLSLILLTGLLAAWLFLYLFRQASDPPLSVFRRQLSDRETLFSMVLSTIVVIFLTSVGSVLISALMVGVGIVCAHDAFRVPENLFLDEPEAQGGVPDILSFLIGAPAVPQAAVSASA